MLEPIPLNISESGLILARCKFGGTVVVTYGCLLDLNLKKRPRMLKMCGMHNGSKSLLVLNTLTNSNFIDLHLRTCSCYVGISEQISPNHTVLHLFAKLTKEQQYAEDVVTLFCLIFLFKIAE